MSDFNPIENMAISKKTELALLKSGIHSIDQLLKMSDGNIYNLKNINTQQAREITSALMVYIRQPKMKIQPSRKMAILGELTCLVRELARELAGEKEAFQNLNKNQQIPGNNHE